MKENAAVVIPFYKVELTDSEQISLQQCMKVFSGYSIFLVVPEKCYAEWKLTELGLSYIKMDNRWFENIASYNMMMLSSFFYERFVKFEYILIYQLDAFVFSDRLEEFCSYGYDYIGAPWLNSNAISKNFDEGLVKVGNGGFSLRKTKAFLQLLKKGKIEWGFDDLTSQEDVIWSSQNSAAFRVAPVEIALKFSFETQVRKCYSLNGNKLPFGCHAWERYDFNFWRPFIEEEGYSLSRKIEGDLDKKKELDNQRLKLHLHQFNRDGNLELYIFGTGEIGKWIGGVLLFHIGMENIGRIITYILAIHYFL